MRARATVYKSGTRRSRSMSVSDVSWQPDPEAASRTRIARFMRRHGLATLEALQRRSVDDIEWYWDAVSRDLGWVWSSPYDRVADLSRGIQWPRWFPGGRTNLAANCVDKHLAARGGGLAGVSEAESGEGRGLTYPELGAEVGRVANAVRRAGGRPAATSGGTTRWAASPPSARTSPSRPTIPPSSSIPRGPPGSPRAPCSPTAGSG